VNTRREHKAALAQLTGRPSKSQPIFNQRPCIAMNLWRFARRCDAQHTYPSSRSRRNPDAIKTCKEMHTCPSSRCAVLSASSSDFFSSASRRRSASIVCSARRVCECARARREAHSEALRGALRDAERHIQRHSERHTQRHSRRNHSTHLSERGSLKLLDGPSTLELEHLMREVIRGSSVAIRWSRSALELYSSSLSTH
jgi:hypothetical protein